MVALLPILIWVAQITIVAIFVQTLYSKFTGAAESIEIFSAIGLEPWGRYVVGSLELIASILLLVPYTSWYGALLSLFIIVPALIVHLFKVGLVVHNDRGLLFGLALAIFVLAIAVLLLRWNLGPFAFKTS
ncbi:MAG: DoxX family membrane protein [Nanoarchaeota archaeon]